MCETVSMFVSLLGSCSLVLPHVEIETISSFHPDRRIKHVIIGFNIFLLNGLLKVHSDPLHQSESGSD